jgi:hypothetical protein
MASMSRRLAQLLHDLSILHPAQYGFVVDGSCLEPLSITNRMYENSLAADKPLHLAYLDATSAFDSIPHVALDAALTRIGAPPSFITWIRSMLDGHRRVVATAYGVSAVEDAAVLQAGEPQGCPASPIIWAILVDFALAYADQVGGTGYDLEGALVRQLCFADDLKGADVCGSGLQLTTSAHVIAMGAFGVRFNAHKSYYAWSPAVEHTTDQTHKHGLTLPALDADGRWQRVTLTPVPPRGDDKGGTCAARGAVRYLGLHFSFLGTDGINRWQEQQQIESHIIDSFFARCESVRPTITQFAQIIESVLFGKLLIVILLAHRTTK